MILRTDEPERLSPRWEPLRWHPVQHRLTNDRVRFKVCWAGRRSGKTERAKRAGVMAAILAPAHIERFRAAFMCPTWRQAKDVYWEDLKSLVPPQLIARVVTSELAIELKNRARIECIGMQSPARAEGSPLHWAGWDEAGDHLDGAFQKHVQPALDTPGQEGVAWIYGVPRSGGGFRKMSEVALDPTVDDWAAYTWPSSDILDEKFIAAARASMDPRLFSQEYEANWVNFAGRIYYTFQREIHAAERLIYDPDRDLVFTLDFNVAPGVAGVIQPQTYRGSNPDVAEEITAKVGEVFIPTDSNTPMVCRKLAEDWGPSGVDHQGLVYVHGDATGGSRKTGQTEGTDWDLVRQTLGPVFGERLRIMRNRGNPAERARVNAVNSRFTSADGKHHFLIDPIACPKSVQDYEEVCAKEGTNGEIEKDRKKHPELTDLSDADGYYIFDRFPVDDTPQGFEVRLGL